MSDLKIETYEIVVKNGGKNQVIESEELLKKLGNNHWDLIKNIENRTKQEEKSRITSNSQRHNERIVLLNEIETQIPEEQKKIEARMQELMEIEQSDELYQQFENLKKMTAEIMSKKDQLIDEFNKELNYKDQQYVNSLKNFRINIEKMIELMRKQFIDMRRKYLEELITIEEKFKSVRKDLIDQYKENIKNLIINLQKTEDKFENELRDIEFDNEKDSENQAYKLEMEFINKILKMEKYYNYLREQIEDHNYDLKIQLERLDYRVEVRKEKIAEMKLKDKKYDEELKKVRDIINKKKDQYKKSNKEKRDLNLKLKEDLKKMTVSFDELKKQFKHFEIHDDITFNSIYKMNSDEAKELAIKVALADKTIKIQQLGLDYDPKKKDCPDGFSIEELQKDKLEEERKQMEEELPIGGNQQENFREEVLNNVSSERVKEVFSYIIQQAEFLIEIEIIEKCENLSLEEKLPQYVESISKALGIKNVDEMNDLLAVFYSHNENKEDEEVNKIVDDENYDPDNDEKNMDISSKNETLVVDVDKVLDILKEFYEKKNNKNKERIHNNITSSNGITQGLSEEAKKEKMRYFGEIYWQKLSNIISQNTYNVWKALDKAFLKYHDLLFERKELINDTKNLYDESRELKTIFKGYLDSNLNDALRIPPTQTIKIDYDKLGLNGNNDNNFG